MKKKFLFFSIVAALALAGCSSDEPLVDSGNGNGDGNGEIRYLAVNIVSPTEGGTRTAGQQFEDQNPGGTSEYEYGLATENSVKMVRFYFFDNNDNAVAVKADGSSYFDWNPADDTNYGEEEPNIEKTLKAVLVISTKARDDRSKLPTKMAAVVNPTWNETPKSTVDLSALETKVLSAGEEFLSDTKDGTTTKYFLMSSSVYKKGTSVVKTSPVTTDNLQISQDAAEKMPVPIYVERAVAKVRLTSGITGTDKVKTYTDASNVEHTIYATGAKYEVNNTEKDVYVEFLGWNLTAEANQSNMLKSISASWAENLFGTSPTTSGAAWNYDLFFRSFWAINPTTGTTYPNTNTYTSLTTTGNYFGFKADPTLLNYRYCRENAATATDGTKANAADNTKVIIAARLCDENGSNVELASYAGEYVSINGLKASILKTGINLYKEATDGDLSVGDKKYKKIDANDITFKTVSEIAYEGDAWGTDKKNEKKVATGSRYYVCAQLADDSTPWYTYNETAEAKKMTSVTSEEANTTLENIGKFKIWKEAKTYYYFDIEHLAKVDGSTLTDAQKQAQAGWYGVVRNHIYAANLNSVVGIGTPVYDPDEVIIPEKPSDDETYIAAQIKILSWRVVNSDIDLNW